MLPDLFVINLQDFNIILGIVAVFVDPDDDVFAPVDPGAPLVGMTVLENALYGKLSDEAGPRTEAVRATVAEVLREEGVSRDVLRLVFDVPISLGGANLPAAFAEPLAVSRAVIKGPDILVLDQVMTSFDPATRSDMIRALRAELPKTTLVYLAAQPEEDLNPDLAIEITQGRLTGPRQPNRTPAPTAAM